jgi:hypothetical protein
MPKTAAATRTDMAATSLHNRSNVAGSGQVFHLELVYEGVQVKPEDLFDALEAKYGSGKVTADTDTVAQNQARLRIKP